MARKERLDSFLSNMGLPSFQTGILKSGKFYNEEGFPANGNR
jgi:hypothetical protein